MRLGRGWKHPRHFPFGGLSGAGPDTKAFAHRYVRGGSRLRGRSGVLGVQPRPARRAGSEARGCGTVATLRWIEATQDTRRRQTPLTTPPRTQRRRLILKRRRSPNTLPRSTSSCSTTFAISKANQVEQLQRALRARERLSGETNSAGQDVALASVEDEIRGLLIPADYATYEILRESDLELFKLNEYAGGISNVAPLSAADRESILKTKLAYKARFRQLLRDSGLAAQRPEPGGARVRVFDDFARTGRLPAQLPPGGAPVPRPTKNNLRC